MIRLLLPLLLLVGCATPRLSAPPPVAPREEPAPAPQETSPVAEAVAAVPPPAEPPLPPAVPSVAPRVPFTIEPQVQDRALAQAAYRKGVAALKARDLPAAIEQLSACAAHQTRRADCRWELGWALFQDARWQDARDVWTQVAQGRRGDPQVEKALALVEAQARLQETLDAAEAFPPPPLAPAPPDSRLRLRAVGDVMLGTDFPAGLLPPQEGATVLQAVAPLLADADLTFVNLEGPLCDSGSTAKCGKRGGNCYAFRSPTRYADHLVTAGVDLASTANNHSGDFGEGCRRETEQALDARQIAWSGPPGTVATKIHQGLRIGMVAFHTNPATQYLLDLETARRLVRATAQTHHLVVVSFHGGAEGAGKQRVPPGSEFFFGEDRGDLRRFAHAVVEAGADLVLGHGPHVLRGMELYQDRLIAYSLGNFATYGPFTLSGPQGLGAILEVVLDPEGRFVGGLLLPTRQVGEGIPQPDPEKKALERVRTLSREDFPDTYLEVGEDGTLSRRAPSTVSWR